MSFYGSTANDSLSRKQKSLGTRGSTKVTFPGCSREDEPIPAGMPSFCSPALGWSYGLRTWMTYCWRLLRTMLVQYLPQSTEQKARIMMGFRSIPRSGSFRTAARMAGLAASAALLLSAACSGGDSESPTSAPAGDTSTQTLSAQTETPVPTSTQSPETSPTDVLTKAEVDLLATQALEKLSGTSLLNARKFLKDGSERIYDPSPKFVEFGIISYGNLTAYFVDYACANPDDEITAEAFFAIKAFVLSVLDEQIVIGNLTEDFKDRILTQGYYAIPEDCANPHMSP